MCLLKFANFYTIPERKKRIKWKNKKTAVCKCFIFSLLFPKAALVSAETGKQYIEIVPVLPVRFWAVAQCRSVWVEIPQREQHSHLLNDFSLSETSQDFLWLNSKLPPNREAQGSHDQSCALQLCFKAMKHLDLTRVSSSVWLCRILFSSLLDTTLF